MDTEGCGNNPVSHELGDPQWKQDKQAEHRHLGQTKAVLRVRGRSEGEEALGVRGGGRVGEGIAYCFLRSGKQKAQN